MLAEAIEREWSSRAEGRLDVRQCSVSELLLMISEVGKLSTDVVVYPSHLMGDLAESNLITSIPKTVLQSDRMSVSDILPLVRRVEMEWQGKPMAVSFGAPRFFLIHRNDHFEQLGLTYPQTWGDYERLAQRLSAARTTGELTQLGDTPYTAVAVMTCPVW